MTETPIITNKSLYFATRRVEQRETEGSRTIISYSEKANIDIKQIHKVKDQMMINTLLKLIPKGIRRDIFLSIMNCNTHNIIQVNNRNQTVVHYLSEKHNITTRGVSKALRFFVIENWVIRLNKYEYMANPYLVLRNDLGTKKIEQLQIFWDELVDGVEHKEPIVWGQTTDYDEDLKQNLTEIGKNITKRQQDMLRLKQAKKKELAEDIQTVNDNLPILHLLLTKFLEFHKDKYTRQSIDKQHFRNWLVKQPDCPLLYDQSIKPFSSIITTYNKETK